jgi:predicted membrane protein
MVTLFSLGRSLGHVGPGFLLLWLVFLISLAVVALRTPARRVTIRRFIAVVFLLIISVVILATGAFFGFLASTGVPLSGGNGVHVWQPNSPDAVRHEYTTEFGSENVDLAAVEFPSSGFRITASTAVGYLRVTVPSGAVVSVTTNVGMGTVQYGLNLSEGRPYAALPSPHLDAAQLRNAPHLALDARVGIGHIVILRASSRP